MEKVELGGVSENHGILLANLLQRSRTSFSCVSFPSCFAFEEGLYDPQTSALLSSPTVSARYRYTRREGQCCRYHGHGNSVHQVRCFAAWETKEGEWTKFTRIIDISCTRPAYPCQWWLGNLERGGGV